MDHRQLSRREALAGIGAGLLLVSVTPIRPAFAALADAEIAIREAVGDPSLAQEGRVFIDMPPLAESGNSVPITIRVDSPMTPEDHVRTIWAFTPENPRPRVAVVHLGPRAGRAEFSTKIRMAKSQDVIAFARMSDGSLWTKTVNVTVTVGACESLRYQL
jgi:sulfur-oxidizing protein SoxY